MADPESSTQSGDRAERLQARRARMEAKKAARLDDGSSKDRVDTDMREASKGRKQIADSLSLLDREKATSIERVTSVRVVADNRENDRRIEEENKRQQRLWRLQEEAVASGKANAAVEMRWNDLMEHNMPQDLNKEIQKQKAACASIIQSKDSLVREFQNELKAKDEEYVKALKRQGEEIEEVLSYMDKQYAALHRAYQQQLDTIEDEFMKERAELLATNKAEIDALFDKRRKMEMHFLDEKQRREDQYQTEIEEMQSKDAEDYNKLKIKLETDIQTLEQQLEAMRATYLLNTEKLEYNYRVLTERDNENSATLNQQKRKLTRLKDTLSGLMQKYAVSDKQYKSQNAELTEEYRRITKQYKDLQQKYRHFERADNKKYQEVWAMHETELSELVDKLLQADQIIHEQLLGLEWIPPSAEGTVKSGRPFSPGEYLRTSGNASPAAGGATGGASGAAGSAAGSAAGAAAGSASPRPDDGAPDSRIAAAVEAHKAEDHRKKIQVMLQLLVQEASFLIDAQAQSAAAALKPSDAAVVRADAVLKALSISSEEDVNMLLGYFFDDESDAAEEGSATPREPAERLKVAPEEVVRTVQQFVRDREAARREELAGDGVRPLRAEELARSTRRGADTRSVGSMESDTARARREEREFWRRMTEVVPSRTVQVWKALERSLEKYSGILQARSDLASEVSGLRVQNEELRNVLNQYLGAQVNDELQIPPTQVIRLQQTSH